MHLVLTACTNRKRIPAPSALRVSTIERGPLAQVAEAWAERLRTSGERVPAGRLYAGRGFQEAVRAVDFVGAEFAIVSAGLGLVDANELVPSYALSVATGSVDCITPLISGEADPTDWWREISRRSPFSRELAQVVASTSGVVLVTLSEAYLAMVAEELAALPARDAARLRILTRASADRIHPGLLNRIMPYDDRLDGPDSIVRGTRGDFAARAARHFAQVVLAEQPAGSVEAHSAAVVDALASWRPAPSFERERHDDEALLQIIRKHWDTAGGQSTKLLRVLRDDLNIACEQGRFVGLMKRLRAERELVA